MASQPAADVLFEIKNSFYIGNYQNCINEAQKCSFSDSNQQLEKEIFMYRAYIAQRKYGVVVNDINSSCSPELQHIHLLAVYHAVDESKRKDTVKLLEDKLQNINPDDKILPLIASLIYYAEENYDTVLRLLFQTDNLECYALKIQVYLKINRTDLAQKELTAMKAIDEDNTLTQLCQAWFHLSKNGPKLMDAFYIFQELSDKYSSTPVLLNGQAAALLAMGKYEEAEPLLQEALDKDPNCAETLINLIILSQYIGKQSEVSIRYLNQLKDSHSNHPFVKEYKTKEQEFDRLAKMYVPA